jgi:hypothetical protein
MSEEESQVFRTDEHIQVAAAEGQARKKKKAPTGPSDQRAVKDQEGGLSETRALRDGSDASEVRQISDAQGGGASSGTGKSDGPSDGRAIRDADGSAVTAGTGKSDGPSDMRAMLDADGQAVAGRAQQSDGPSDPRALRGADSPLVSSGAVDGDGPSDLRNMRDAEGNALLRQSQGGESPSDQRNMQDHWADVPNATRTGEHETNAAAAAAAAEAASAVQEPTEPDMVSMAKENASAWVLSIHLEERIQNLGAMTTKVSAQLDVLEDAVKRLGKRIGQ